MKTNQFALEMMYQSYGKDKLDLVDGIIQKSGISHETIVKHLIDEYDYPFKFILTRVFSFLFDKLPRSEFIEVFTYKARACGFSMYDGGIHTRLTKDILLCHYCKVDVGALEWKHIRKILKTDPEVTAEHIQIIKAFFETFK